MADDSIPLHAWPPFVLGIPDAETRLTVPGHSAVPEGEPVLYGPNGPKATFAWPSHRVFDRLFHIAMSQLLTEKKIPRDAPVGLDMNEIDRWVKATRELAARWQYGPAKSELLTRTADAIEHTFVLREYVKRNRWPTTAGRLQQFRTSLAWWTLEQYRTGLAALARAHGVRHVYPTSAGRFTEQLVQDGRVRLELPELTPKDRATLERALASGSLDRRIRHAGTRIRPGAESQVMAWTLHDALFLSSDDDCGRFPVAWPTAPAFLAPASPYLH